MANSIYEATGDGSTTDFTIPYTYLEADDVTAFVGGVSTSFTFTSNNVITFSTAPASGASVRILRNTDVDNLNVNYSDGGALTASDLNTSNTQLLFGIQEAIDIAKEAMAIDQSDGKFNAQHASANRVIKNVGTPTDANDATTKSYVDTSANNAATSAAAALVSQNAAAASATAAANSATAAAGSATTAASEATDSANSATASASSATASANSASAASTSKSNAATSAATATTQAALATTNGATQVSLATTQANNAAASATTASTQAANASSSASTAATQATNSATSATASSNSATAAANSATAAAASQTAAAASAASAASAFDNFDDTYLGSKTSDPTQDNDGNSLVSGALYFNSTTNEMRVYDGANWIAATSAGNVSLILYEYTATSNQTTFSGSDDNSATLSYTVNNLQVVMNGVILDPSDYTATNGTSVVLAAGAATNDLVNIYAFKSFTTADMVSKTNGGTFAGNVDFSAGIDVVGNATFADNGKAIFGAGSDLQIWHSGASSNIKDNGTGNLNISADELVFYNAATNEKKAEFTSNGAVDLYHDNSKKFETTATGISITGDATFADNDKAIFGAGSDLEIYHDGSNSYVSEQGTGNLNVLGTSIEFLNSAANKYYLAMTDGGSLTAYHNGSAKVATTATGADITGVLTADGVTVTGTNADLVLGTTGSNVTFNRNGDNYISASGGTSSNIILDPQNRLAVNTGGSERLRVDSSGNVLVGKTSASESTAGTELNANGYALFVRDSNRVMQLNRTTSSGEILRFSYNGTTVGNIQNKAGFLSIGTGVTGLMFAGSENAIEPHNISTQSGRDNAIDLGAASVRFDDIRATNGTIQTSDQNDKQQIASLTSAEIAGAKSISTLFKTFKWNDKVEAKGDAARTHAGVIAQDVEAAMTAAGLDATKYAFWCSDTWWEHSVDVAAVEAVDEVLDDDGNVVTEAVEAVAAYTRIDTYQTAEEAPEGATERTRLGIRYPELLAFVGAATEQRLGDIETRLAALEAGE